jgi:hypothetical protein
MLNYYTENQKIREALGERPSAIIKFWGYAKGKVIDSFDTRKLAEDAGATSVESYCVNEPEIKAWDGRYKELISALDEKWRDALREEYSDLPDEVYNLVYNKAYEDGHSYGYDEVANYMIDLADMAVKIMDIAKGK